MLETTIYAIYLLYLFCEWCKVLTQDVDTRLYIQDVCMKAALQPTFTYKRCGQSRQLQITYVMLGWIFSFFFFKEWKKNDKFINKQIYLLTAGFRCECWLTFSSQSSFFLLSSAKKVALISVYIGFVSVCLFSSAKWPYRWNKNRFRLVRTASLIG